MPASAGEASAATNSLNVVTSKSAAYVFNSSTYIMIWHDPLLSSERGLPTTSGSEFETEAPNFVLSAMSCTPLRNNVRSLALDSRLTRSNATCTHAFVRTFPVDRNASCPSSLVTTRTSNRRVFGLIMTLTAGFSTSSPFVTSEHMSLSPADAWPSCSSTGFCGKYTQKDSPKFPSSALLSNSPSGSGMRSALNPVNAPDDPRPMTPGPAPTVKLA
mmetsp:Transcript_77965/g.188881  ORF Transcript_77965/g.188881 Transcript_77965/m.188881 type:complete len:216 (-) Transcript_77965:34-681(-)